MKKKAFVPIGNFKYYKPSYFVPKTAQITVSSKRRLTDTVIWNGKHVRVEKMIKKHPLELWNMIHNRKKGDQKYSLVPNAHGILKNRIKKLKPELVEKVNKQHDYHKTMRRLKKDMANGLVGTEKSRFRSIGSRDMIK